MPWKKGQSGNPNGRPKVVAEVQELARTHTETAMRALVDIVTDEEAPPAARVSAASVILDRGYGKAPQSMTVRRVTDASDLTDDELLAIIERERSGDGTPAASSSPSKPDRVH